jgi:hypothetical protein
MPSGVGCVTPRSALVSRSGLHRAALRAQGDTWQRGQQLTSRLGLDGGEGKLADKLRPPVRKGSSGQARQAQRNTAGIATRAVMRCTEVDRAPPTEQPILPIDAASANIPGHCCDCAPMQELSQIPHSLCCCCCCTRAPSCTCLHAQLVRAEVARSQHSNSLLGVLEGGGCCAHRLLLGSMAGCPAAAWAASRGGSHTPLSAGPAQMCGACHQVPRRKGALLLLSTQLPPSLPRPLLWAAGLRGSSSVCGG